MITSWPAAASGVSHGKIPVHVGNVRPAAANNSARPMKRKNGGPPGKLAIWRRIGVGNANNIRPWSRNSAARINCANQIDIYQDTLRCEVALATSVHQLR